MVSPVAHLCCRFADLRLSRHAARLRRAVARATTAIAPGWSAADTAGFVPTYSAARGVSGALGLSTCGGAFAVGGYVAGRSRGLRRRRAVVAARLAAWRSGPQEAGCSSSGLRRRPSRCLRRRCTAPLCAAARRHPAVRDMPPTPRVLEYTTPAPRGDRAAPARGRSRATPRIASVVLHTHAGGHLLAARSTARLAAAVD